MEVRGPLGSESYKEAIAYICDKRVTLWDVQKLWSKNRLKYIVTSELKRISDPNNNLQSQIEYIFMSESISTLNKNV